jgi:3-deoxy-7-phosphoheptulonate synthase
MDTPKLKITHFSHWLGKLNFPLIIAGPCSAETEAQTLSTATELAKNPKVKIFRAGIWKPRTRPNTFEGVGEAGLSWLKKVKEKTGLLVATEVANSDHVQMAVKYGIDVLWVGARTTTNPFSVQEIADSLRGRDVIVMVKNPVTPDIDLWIGALERINNAGITKLMAVHRGFTTLPKGNFRNPPEWKHVIELKRQIPGLPVICDPSHICGNRELIKSVSQQAINLDYSGLMIESHINPSRALSDKHQQLMPSALNNLLNELIPKDPSFLNPSLDNKLESLRDNIDKIDSEIIEMLGQRMKIVREIGTYKKENKITILQIKRWSDIIKSRTEEGEKLLLNNLFVQKLFQFIHEESINIQSEIINSADNK